MSDEPPKRSLFTRPGFLFSVAGVWLLLAITQFLLQDGSRRWISLSLALLLTVLYVVQGIAAVRKERRAR
jgi:uncharacterized membrane protein SirB2